MKDRPGTYRSHVNQLYLQRQAIRNLQDLRREQDLDQRILPQARPSRLPGGDRDGLGRRPSGGDYWSRDLHDDRHDGRHDWYRRHPGYRRYHHYDGSIIITWPGVYYRYYPTTYAYTESYVYAQPQVQVVAQTVAVPMNDHGAEISTWAWTLIRSDRPDEALEVFSHLARTYPAAGVPRMGEAIALALLGEPARSAWAMRRAVRIDPDAIGFVPADDLTRERLQWLVDVYRRREVNGISATDSAFMQAALHAMRGEVEAARLMADLAIQVGDDTEGAAALKTYLARTFLP